MDSFSKTEGDLEGCLLVLNLGDAVSTRVSSVEITIFLSKLWAPTDNSSISLYRNLLYGVTLGNSVWLFLKFLCICRALAISRSLMCCATN